MTKREPADLFLKGLHQEEQTHFSTEEKPNAYIHLLNLIGSSEDEFIARSYAEWMQALMEKHAGKRPTPGEDPELDLKWEIFESHVKFLNRDPEWFTVYAVPPEVWEHYRGQRIALIQKAFGDAIPLPLAILEEYPADLFSVENPPEARQAARANFSGEMDDSLLRDYGCWLRRQDGMKVLPAERDEIRSALDEIWLALGDLSDLFRATRLTIIHTSGASIFGEPSWTYGLYSHIEGTVVIGRANVSGQNDLSGLAHELAGHWLDHISSPPRMWLVEILKTESLYSPHTLTTAFVDALIWKEGSVYPWLLAVMNPILTKTQQGLIEYYTPSEVFARLAEQYVAYRVARKKKSGWAAVRPPASYYDLPGYWNRSNWKRCVRDLAQEQVRARLWMAQKRYTSEEYPSLRVSKTYTQVFPWAEGLDLLFLRLREMRKRQKAVGRKTDPFAS